MKLNPITWFKAIRRANLARGLELAMHEMALKDSRDTRTALYSRFLKVSLFVPAKAETGDQNKLTQLQFRIIEPSAGRIILPVFTSLELMNNWDPNQNRWIEISARAIFQSISGGPIKEVVINPFPSDGKMLKPGGFLKQPEFEALGKGFLPHVDTFKNRTFEMQGPKEILQNPSAPATPLPGKIYFLIAEALASCPKVKGAYYFDVQIGAGRLTPIVGYEFDGNSSKDEIRKSVESVSMTLPEYGDPDFGIDMAPIDSKSIDRIKAVVKPFYVRPS